MICIFRMETSRSLPKMNFVIILWLISLCSCNVRAATHWMVTESGLIQPRVDSQFEMERPYDLLAFLNQDTRWDNIISLYHDLSARHTVISKLWSDFQELSDVTTLVIKEENCNKAGQLNYIDWFTTFLEEGKSKKIPEEEYMLYKPSKEQETDVPECKKISSLTFSMFAFEHLESLMHRQNLTAVPEITLPELVSPLMNINQFGHWAAVSLRKNSSSWLHYNMASLFWRIRGHFDRAMECSRRAVYYAPRAYKDIALLSMGSILHRSKKTEDAVVVLGAAVEHDPKYKISQFILATAYAVLGQYNNSLKHMNSCLDIDPNFALAKRYKHAILCHSRVLQRTDVLRGMADKLREEIIEFIGRESHWLKSQSAFLRTMKNEPDFDFRSVHQTCKKMSQMTGLNFVDLKAEGDRYSVIKYFLDGPVSISEKLQERGILALDSAYSLQRLVKHIEKHANLASNYVQPDLTKLLDGEILKEFGPMPVFPDIFPILKDTSSSILETKDKIESQTKKVKQTNKKGNEFAEYFGGHILYPPTMQVSRNVEDFDREHEWPTTKMCSETASRFPGNLEAVFPAFLPFENKGIRLNSLLSHKIGVPLSEEHELPWHPPVCPPDKDAAAFTNKKSNKQQMSNEVVNTGFLRQKLLEYAGDGDIEAVMHMQDVEIGHRIYTAMQMKLAPVWLLSTLSSLYWRVRGINVNALHCLLAASRVVPPNYKDLVLTSLGSLYLEMGFFDDALTVAEESFKISVYEPATNFLLAELNMLKKHRNTHMFHLKQTIRVEPSFMGGLARNLLNGWACILKQVTPLPEVDFGDGDICTQVEPGINMVCEKGGKNCHVTNIQCFSSQERDKSTSALIRMLELKDERTKETSSNTMDDSMFDGFIHNMPSERTNKMAHQQNYDSMLHSVQTALKGCGPRGCNDMRHEKMDLKEEECTYQHLQLNYWLQQVTYKELLDEIDPSLALEIGSLPQSIRNTLDCRLPVDPIEDFYLERMVRVDIANWEPELTLMHQVTELFEYEDYLTVGGRLATQLEIKPTGWGGLLVSGWWCGAGGRGACAVRCLAAAHALAPALHRSVVLRTLSAILHTQSKHIDAKDLSYLAFYSMPKNKHNAFHLGVTHTYAAEYEQAVWMYRYSLTFDQSFLPPKAALHATICLLVFGDNLEKPKPYL